MRKQIIPALAAALMLLAACAAPEAVPSDTPAPTPTLSTIETPEAEPSAAPLAAGDRHGDADRAQRAHQVGRGKRDDGRRAHAGLYRRGRGTPRP